ncbi:YcnI family protein [Pikeienuella sp. HZG-20]|uniref:YcnI family copper-binding membrane protein n=1 Tax=Paludibacillus litoralis TaxID=3133267 RepID=UPI0030EF6798
MKTVPTAFAALALLAPAASAHVNITPSEAPQGATFVGALGVGHGCDGESTLKLRVQIPEGVIAVKPTPKPGWDLEIVTGAFEKSYEHHGATVSEGVKELIWTGELPDAYFDTFSFRGALTDAFPAGSTVYFPVVQECATAARRWVEIPAEGQNAHDLDAPAAGLKVTAPGHGHH